jgi:hypothetical protein
MRDRMSAAEGRGQHRREDRPSAGCALGGRRLIGTIERASMRQSRASVAALKAAVADVGGGQFDPWHLAGTTSKRRRVSGASRGRPSPANRAICLRGRGRHDRGARALTVLQPPWGCADDSAVVSLAVQDPPVSHRRNIRDALFQPLVDVAVASATTGCTEREVP